MNLYILGPDDGGDGVYQLVAETGEPLASHYCSHRGFAPGDLEGQRPERQQEWHARFGEYRVLWLGDDGVTEDELVRRNQAWYEAAQATQTADNVSG